MNRKKLYGTLLFSILLLLVGAGIFSSISRFFPSESISTEVVSFENSIHSSESLFLETRIRIEELSEASHIDWEFLEHTSDLLDSLTEEFSRLYEIDIAPKSRFVLESEVHVLEERFRRILLKQLGNLHVHQESPQSLTAADLHYSNVNTSCKEFAYELFAISNSVWNIDQGGGSFVVPDSKPNWE